MILNQRRRLAWGLGIGLLALGCESVRKSEPGRLTLRVAAASDLREVLPVLANRFQEKTGRDVAPIFGASGQLAEQIKAGAPFDVFLSANRAFVDELAEQGMIEPGSVAPMRGGLWCWRCATSSARP